MSAGAGLRALGRIERRALSAHPWRTALVVLLVAVPTAALVGGSTLWTSLRPRAATADGFEGLVLLVIGGFGFGEAALVIAAAFAVGLRRRQREIGLAGASGATPGALQLAVLGAALAQALVGTLLGLGVGLVAARALHPWLARWSAEPGGPLTLSTPHVLAALALGPCAALAAAALPARAAARLPIRVALGGRRPATTRARGWLVAGLGLAGGGAALLAWASVRGDAPAATGILAGSVLALAGFGAVSPWLLDALARRAGPLPLAWRLALRDAGRFRARNGPVVTAVLAGLALCVLLATVQAAVEARVGADPLSAAPERVYLHVALTLALVTGLVVVGVATALSAVESADDARTLRTLGAPPGLLRRHLAARAAYLAALGGVLAVPAGLLPALGLLSFADAPLPFVAPWSTLAIAVLVLPALAWTGTWLCAAARGEPPEERTMPTSLVPLLAALLVLAPTSHAQEDVPEIAWEPFPARARGGRELDGMLGRIQVPERRDVASGKTIELAFVVFPSTNPEPGPPIFFLVGGPGASGTEFCAEVAGDPRTDLLAFGDVVGIDQRGTGRSRPNISDGPEFEYELPLDRAVTATDVSAAHAAAVERCLAHWRAQGVDPAGYDSEENADDVDTVRRALGLEKIVLWGTSYGSHLGLAYLRRHAAHAARAVLMKVESPDATWKLPSTGQALLEAIHARVAADPAAAKVLPDLLGSLRAVLARLAAEPVSVTLGEGTNDEVSVTVGPYDVQRTLAEMLASTQGHALVPYVVRSLEQGDWQRLARSALRYRVDSVSSAMLVLMDCASGASPERRARLARESADPKNLLGDALNAPYYLETCKACGPVELDARFRGPLACDVPVLFVSGSLDGRTPPQNVEDIRAGFTDHAHVLVENTGHDERELESAEYCALVRDFLAGKRVASRTIKLPLLPLAPLER